MIALVQPNYTTLRELLSAWQGETDGYLFVLKSIEPFNQDEFKEKDQEIRKGLTNELVQLHVSALIAFLHRTATIKINKNLINSGR